MVDASADPDLSLGVHLLAGLPTEAVRVGIARASDVIASTSR